MNKYMIVILITITSCNNWKECRSDAITAGYPEYRVMDNPYRCYGANKLKTELLYMEK